MLMKKQIIYILVIFTIFKQQVATQELFDISGRINLKKSGNLTIKLETNSENIDDYFSQSYEIEISNEDVELGYIEFYLADIPGDTYSIIVLQDVNGNGIFDIGKFGPSEPWGNYRWARPSFRGATFEEMAFELNDDLRNIVISIR